jgi:2-polyprenyl-3-methyl-5-hydroxy-6-metoxy-1,4-benzoquinol methylase
MNCKICGSKNIKTLFVKDNIGLTQCKNCNVMFTYPEPTEQQINDFYNKQNYFKHWFEYKNIKLQTDSERLNKILEFNKLNGNLLDFGCGIGYFLSNASKNNFNCYGIEYSDFAVTYCKNEFNLNVNKFSGFPLNYKKNFFQLITVWHTLEHLKNPNEFLNEIYRILDNDGMLVIEIPNSKSLLTLLRGKKSLPLIEHLFHYTPESVEFLLKKHNFKILKNSPGAPGYTRKGIKIFIKKILALLGKIIYKITRKNYSDTILLYCKKKFS